MWSSRFLLSLLAAMPFAMADVSFTVPAAGAPIPGGTSITITWTDSSTAPPISELSAYQLFLYSGSNTAPQQLYSLGQGTFAQGNSFTATIPTGVGGTGTNA
ncbi:hypothetical protein DH86_00002383 [Scytalidium sp. 3C]|nr:hypothetical protein DH86_00002383 [Scytalidium sp. 3C]